MATIDKKLIHFNRLADFEARLAAGDIRDYSIVCIKDAKKIWTHGEYYGDLSECLTKYPQEFTKEEKEQMLENLGYYFIEWDGEYGIIELSEEEYRKVLSATNVYLVAMDMIYLFPTLKFNGMYSYTFIQEDGIVNFLLDISTNPMIINNFSTLIPKTTSELTNDSNFISSDNLKTINGEPILGEGNIELDTTISANATDDDVIVLTGTPGTNGVSYDAKHAKKFSTSNSTYTSGNSTTSISGSGGKGTIKIPQITVDSYGHVTAAADEDINITMPSVPTTLKNPNALTIGSQTYDGSSKVTITAADLGLSSALKYHGTTTTALTDGATTKPIVIGGSNHNQEQGCVVAYNNSSFVWTGSAWEELGNPGNYKVIQNAVSSPSASGNALAFIDTISQDANGTITATKKNVQTASTSVYGVTKLSSATNSASEDIAATPKAVKTAYDLASSKWTYNADTIKAIKVNTASTADVANSVNWTNVNNKPTNLSQFTDDVVAGKYLPLSGGTLSGHLILDHNSRIKMNGLIEFYKADGSCGAYLGTITDANNLTIYDGRLWSEILHTGNYSSYALPLSGGTITIDSIHSLSVKRNGTGGSFVAYENNNGNLGFLGVGDDGVPKFAASDGVGKKIWHEGNFTPANYLPLSGGTISGDLTIEGTLYATNNMYLNGWFSSRNHYFFVRDNADADWIVTNENWTKEYSLIHSGNIGSQSVSYATSAGNATNALNTKRLVYNDTSPNVSLGIGEIAYSLVPASVAGNLPVKYNANGVLTLNTHQGNYYYQLGFSSNGNIYGRFSEGYELSDNIAWKQIAFTDSNVASATNAAAVNGTKIAIVSQMPASPDSSTLYFVK